MASCNSVENTDFRQLSDLIQAESENYGKPAWVLGSAKSVKSVRKFKNSGINIGIGDMPWRSPNLVSYDYWLTANSIYPIPWHSKHFKHLVNSKTKILISSVAAESRGFDLNRARKSLLALQSRVNLTVYDVRHFGGKHCEPFRNCCLFSREFIRGSSIQEFINYSKEQLEPLYSTGSTVALHGYALAVLFRCNPIYLCGIELPLSQKDYTYHKSWKMPQEKLRDKVNRLKHTTFVKKNNLASPFGGETHSQIIADFWAIAQFAKELNISTFVTSRTSALNNVEGISYKEH